LGQLHLGFLSAAGSEQRGSEMAVAVELENLKELQERVEELRGYL
jgi:hypothetical protein